MSEDPEIAKIMQKKLDAMINQKPEPKIEPGIIDLNDSNFDQIISAETPTLVDNIWRMGKIAIHYHNCISRRFLDSI